MKEKIAEIVGCLREDRKGDCEFCSWPEEQCPSAIQINAILALIEQENAGMREALEAKKKLILDTYTLYIPVDIVVRMLDSLIADAVLEGK